MTQNFLATMLSPPVLQEQQRFYGKTQRVPTGSDGDVIGPDEAAFIQARDSFYLSTVSPDGWPYIQHRGGPRGFLQVRDEHTFAFADLGGNRQLLSTGNLAANDRVALFLMDYPHQERLKLMGHATILPAKTNFALAAELTPEGIAPNRVERIFVIRVTGLNWNCTQHIKPRFTAEEIQAATAPLHERIRELELALKQAN